MPRESLRYELLPKWIRFFSWLFLLMAGSLPLLYIIDVFISEPMQFMIFGIKHVGNPTDPTALLVQAIIVGLGVAAYGLLWGTDWGITAGLVAGAGGLAIVLLSAVLSVQSGTVNIPFEPLLQIPFLVALTRRRDQWARALDASAA